MQDKMYYGSPEGLFQEPSWPAQGFPLFDQAEPAIKRAGQDGFLYEVSTEPLLFLNALRPDRLSFSKTERETLMAFAPATEQKQLNDSTNDLDLVRQVLAQVQMGQRQNVAQYLTKINYGYALDQGQVLLFDGQYLDILREQSVRDFQQTTIEPRRVDWKQMKQEIVSESALQVGYLAEVKAKMLALDPDIFQKVFANNSNAMGHLLQHASEESPENIGAFDNLLVTEMVRQLNYQDFKEIAPYFFNYQQVLNQHGETEFVAEEFETAPALQEALAAGALQSVNGFDARALQESYQNLFQSYFEPDTVASIQNGLDWVKLLKDDQQAFEQNKAADATFSLADYQAFIQEADPYGLISFYGHEEIQALVAGDEKQVEQSQAAETKGPKL
ncbi:hypothetical protein [Fructobacillus tropaeoli]|uniref:hypothetical protein n=1 Tax=Fructobacillus tropaeoli TaxID=709323 RepID=UPI001942FDC6|nr:hypothetical protein [Fructobacillus tropaeoli]GIC69367.1 hypothetical protein FT12353_00030 [Fructobacillus tropaeoli]CAK1253834.1 hypothetical protein R55227_BLOPHJLP_01563 [Fructobacillus tropaeoli]